MCTCIACIYVYKLPFHDLHCALLVPTWSTGSVVLHFLISNNTIHTLSVIYCAITLLHMSFSTAPYSPITEHSLAVHVQL